MTVYILGNKIIHMPDGYQQAFHYFLDSRTFNKMQPQKKNILEKAWRLLIFFLFLQHLR